MDLFADLAQRDEPNPFVELLRGKVSLYGGEALIYGGRIQADGLLGDPDLLRKEGPSQRLTGGNRDVPG